MTVDVLRPRGRPPRFTDRRIEVLRAAARTFGLQGFRQTKLEDVADAVGMTRPSLYYYAKSKDELLADCLTIAEADLDAALSVARTEKTGLAQLHAFFIRYAEIACDDFGRSFVLTDASEMSSRDSERNRKLQLRLGRAVADMTRKGIRDRSVRRCDPVAASRVLFGVFNGMARWYRPKRHSAPAEAANDLLAVVTQGLASISN